ncbi:hypothetical protein C2S53_017544 [Perilla frutescens var. hirtella]|uniref:Uncharacterized protein n=1 Tax=Perilla frutescens var. hirtella TaxID=608512 RepID=A0AAD4JD33_PERFH|nr:hypothetical protein C2S53_017544 [Perilla frutescens var. hirtella]
MVVMLIVCGFGFILVSTLFLVKPSQRAAIVGWICLVFSLGVFIAPLCIVRRVIESKSVEYMPFLLSLFLTLSAVIWCFYGLLIKDYNVAVPNVVGFIFGVVQMALYVKYNKMSSKLPQIETTATTTTPVPDHDGQVIEILTTNAELPSKFSN